MPVPIRARKRQAQAKLYVVRVEVLFDCVCLRRSEEVSRIINSGGSRPSDKGEGVVIRTLRKGGGGQSQKQILSALRASIWSKNKGAPGQAPPLNPPLINAEVRGIYQTYFMTLFLIDLYKMENTCVCLNIIKTEPNFVSLFSIIQ